VDYTLFISFISHGGGNKEGDWVTSEKAVLFSPKPVMMVYRGKLLSLIKKAKTGSPPPDSRENQNTCLLNKLGRQSWVELIEDAW